jgi:hypothetical protein
MRLAFENIQAGVTVIGSELPDVRIARGVTQPPGPA